MLPVIEQFCSINGEGPSSGYLAYFIRFAGCNLRCSWCDTAYSYSGETMPQLFTVEQLYEAVLQSGAGHVTLTGGEPLCQEELPALLRLLTANPYLITEIETNGSYDIAPLIKDFPQIRMIVDYKLSGSGMTEQMLQQNLSAVRMQDAYKLVVSSEEDLWQVRELLQETELDKKTQVFLSPVLGKMEPKRLVEFMQQNRMANVRLQLQLHKYIWDPKERGV